MKVKFKALEEFSYCPMLQGHDVYAEEKIHGTCFISGFIPGMKEDELVDGNKYVTSKGLSSKGIVLSNSVANRSGNLYTRAFDEYHLASKLAKLSEMLDGKACFILGEVYGVGVQDLGYSTTVKSLRVFGIYVGMPNEGAWLTPDDKYKFFEYLDLKTPPVLYKGPFDMEKIMEVTSGLSSLDGVTIREGVVITPVDDYHDDEIGRVILKSVSEDYLLRKGNVTEFN